MTTPPVGSVSHSPMVFAEVRGYAFEVIWMPAFCLVRQSVLGERLLGR